jgi:hypothetical protein
MADGIKFVAEQFEDGVALLLDIVYLAIGLLEGELLSVL